MRQKELSPWLIAVWGPCELHQERMALDKKKSLNGAGIRSIGIDQPHQLMRVVLERDVCEVNVLVPRPEMNRRADGQDLNCGFSFLCLRVIHRLLSETGRYRREDEQQQQSAT